MMPTKETTRTSRSDRSTTGTVYDKRAAVGCGNAVAASSTATTGRANDDAPKTLPNIARKEDGDVIVDRSSSSGDRFGRGVPSYGTCRTSSYTPRGAWTKRSRGGAAWSWGGSIPLPSWIRARRRWRWIATAEVRRRGPGKGTGSASEGASNALNGKERDVPAMKSLKIGTY